MAAQSLGYRVVVLDPGEQSPAGSVADRHIRADYLDPRGLAELAALATRGDDRVRERPGGRARVPRPHRARQPGCGERRDRAGSDPRESVPGKQRLRGRPVCGAREPRRCARTRDAALFPGIVKSARMGYDGKGQIRVASRRGRRARLECDGRACRACSSSSCRSPARCRSSSRARNAARRRPGPSPRTAIATASSTCRSSRRACTDALTAEARAIATAVAAKLDYRGVLCVEMFVTTGGQAARQRDRAAAAQQRPLHDRRLRDVAVRAAGARARRTAAGRHAAARARGDGEPAGRHLVRQSRGRRRRASPTGRACCGIRGRSCTSTASPCLGAAARWVTSPVSPRRVAEALATARAIKRDLGIPGADDL